MTNSLDPQIVRSWLLEDLCITFPDYNVDVGIESTKTKDQEFKFNFSIKVIDKDGNAPNNEAMQEFISGFVDDHNLPPMSDDMEKGSWLT